MAFNEWVRYREVIDLLIKQAKLLLTCRRSVFFDTRATGFFDHHLEDVGIDEQKLVKTDINENDHKLSIDKKKNMFKKHLPDVKPSVSYPRRLSMAATRRSRTISRTW